MVADAEKYKEEDDEVKEKVEAKNQLEGYCFSLRSTITEEETKSKLSEEDIATIEKGTQETLDWIDEQPSTDRTKDEYAERQKTMESEFIPILQKLYAQSQTSAPTPPQSSAEPVVEEVD